MKKTSLINVLNAGELGHDMDTRADLVKYGQGCRVMENMLPIVEGPVQRMPGTKHVLATDGIGITGNFFFTAYDWLKEFKDFALVSTYVCGTHKTYKAPVSDGANIYHSTTLGTSGYIEKFNLATRSYTDEMEIASAALQLKTSAVDRDNGYAYFVNYGTGANSKAYKINLSDFSLDSTLPLSKDNANGMIIDGDYGYVGYTDVAGQHIMRIVLSTFTEDAWLTLPALMGTFWTGAALKINGYGYFMTNSRRILKLNLSIFTADSILILNANEIHLAVAVKDDTYIYCVVQSYPTKIVRVNISTFTRTDVLTLDTENYCQAGIIKRGNIYVGGTGGTKRVAKITTSPFTFVEALDSGIDDDPLGAVDPWEA